AALAGPQARRAATPAPTARAASSGRAARSPRVPARPAPTPATGAARARPVTPSWPSPRRARPHGPREAGRWLTARFARSMAGALDLRHHHHHGAGRVLHQPLDVVADGEPVLHLPVLRAHHDQLIEPAARLGQKRRG